MEGEILKNVSENLKKRGFKKILINNSPKSLFWSFDLYAEDKKMAWAIEIRKNDEVNNVFIEKIKRIKKYAKPLLLYVLFLRPPKKKTFSILKSEGVGILVLKEKEIFVVLNSKNFSKKFMKKKVTKKKLKKERKMPQINVFVSSKQYEKQGGKILKERVKICNIINEIKNTHPIPIFPLLVENTFDGGRKFKVKITKNIRKSDIFICALKEDYGEYIEYEIKKAFEHILDKRLILIFVKNVNPENIEKPQLKLIQYVRKTRKIQTLPYSGIPDFDSLVRQYLMKMITHLYKKNKIKSPFEFS